jgi:hypothetical protein
MARPIALLVLIAALLAPATATAATRYAAPSGGMVPGCSQVSPCSLDYAITAASSGDEVVVTPGQYTMGVTIETETPLWIHGQTGDAQAADFRRRQICPQELRAAADRRPFAGIDQQLRRRPLRPG